MTSTEYQTAHEVKKAIAAMGYDVKCRVKSGVSPFSGKRRFFTDLDITTPGETVRALAMAFEGSNASIHWKGCVC